MARIANVNIPSNKRLVIALTYVYGIGLTTARHICKKANVDLNRRTKDITEQELINVRSIVESDFVVEGELRREVNLNIKKKKDLRTYQGLRHIRRLPVRGQRTHSNARTRKGKAVAIAGKKK